MADRFVLSEDRRWLAIGDRRVPVMHAAVREHRGFRQRGCVVRTETGYDLSIIWGSLTWSSNYDHTYTAQDFIEEPERVEVGIMDADGLVGDPYSRLSPDMVLILLDGLYEPEVIEALRQWREANQ